MTLRAMALAIAAALAAAQPAAAQSTGTRTVALDTVVGVQDYVGDGGAWKTQLIVDSFATVEIAPRLQVLARPILWRMITGAWETHLAHASLRYEVERGSRWRFEVGRFASPVGLGMTENRANINDGVIWWHRAYYSRLPLLGEGAAPHALISSIYPMGVQVQTSGDRWDARAAFIDRAPTDFFRTIDAPARANVVLGAGISPQQGLRLGVATAWGRSGDATQRDPYALVNVEGEYAFGYTRLSGEWVRDRFETPAGVRVAQGLTLQARRTLTPRLYVHGRATAIESPAVTEASATPQSTTSWYADTTVGYHVTPEATVRVSHAAIGRWNAAVDHQIGVSFVWSKRWW